MDETQKMKKVVADLLLGCGVRIENAIEQNRPQAMVDELDFLIDRLILTRFVVVDGAGLCRNPDCPVHGRAASSTAQKAN